jgi:hypothetical protein
VNDVHGRASHEPRTGLAKRADISPEPDRETVSGPAVENPHDTVSDTEKTMPLPYWVEPEP